MTEQELNEFITQITLGQFNSDRYVLNVYNDGLYIRDVDLDVMVYFTLYDKDINPFKNIYRRFKYGSVYLVTIDDPYEIIPISKETFIRFNSLLKTFYDKEKAKVLSDRKKAFNF